MSHRPSARSRLAYSTDQGAKCPKCGWPPKDCRCDDAKPAQAVPEKIVAKLQIEKSGRRGKPVTVVYGLPRNPDFLDALASELKKACACGGTAGEDYVEVQGDQRETIRKRLEAKGWTVKG